MAIQRSAAREIEGIVALLASPDAVTRHTAAARLSTIGPRAVPHLVDGFQAASGHVARVAILKVLETLRDRRGLSLALDVLADAGREPATAAAAIELLGAFLDGESTHALETLGSVAVDATRPELERLAAWHTLARMPERILAPLRRRLARDDNPVVRRRAEQPRQAGTAPPALDPDAVLEAAAARDGADPSLVGAAIRASAATVPLGTLHRVIERARSREDAGCDEADRIEWMELRAAAHVALAGRRSRVALYDARDTVAAATRPLPHGFATALAQVGDAACLDAIADALSHAPADASPETREWRARLLDAGRAILDRERLTRRHAAVRRLVRRHPDAAQALFG